MDCNQAEDLIIELISGKLSKDDRNLVLGHISKCDRCKRMHRFYIDLEASLEGRSDEVPNGVKVAKQILSRFDKRKERSIFEKLPVTPTVISVLMLTGSIALNIYLDSVTRIIPPMYSVIIRITSVISNTFSDWLVDLVNADILILWTLSISVILIISLAGGLIIKGGVKKY